MTPGGWLFMLTSLSAVVALSAWCFYRVTRPAPADATPDDDAP